METKEDIIEGPAITESIKHSEIKKQEAMKKQTYSISIGKMKRSFDDNISDTINVKRKKLLLDKQTCSTNIINLPDELLVKIFLYLETSDIWNISLTCTRMSNLTMDSCLWKNVALKTNLNQQFLEKIFQLMGQQTDKLYLSAYMKSQHVINLNMALKLSVVCKNLTVLHLNHQTLDASEIYITSFPQSLKELSLTDTNMLNTSYIRCFLNRIDSHLVNLETLIFTDCKWFVTHSIMILSRIPKLKCLRLDGCIQLQDCMPYVSLSTRYGFKNLQEIDLRRTFMSDNEVSCFNACRTLRNLYLSCDDRRKRNKKKINKVIYACLADPKHCRSSHTVTCLKNLYNERVSVDSDLLRLNMHLGKLTDNQLLTSREILTQEHLSLQRAMTKVYISKTGYCDDNIDETDESSSSEDENDEKVQLKSNCLLYRKFQRFKQCMKNFKSLVNQYYQTNNIFDADVKSDIDTDIKTEEIDKKKCSQNPANTWNSAANDAEHFCFNFSDDDEDENVIQKMLYFSGGNQVSKQEHKETPSLKNVDDNDNPRPGCSKEIITASPTPGCSKDIDDKEIEYEGQESSDDNVENTNTSARRDASTYCGEPHRFISIVTHNDQYSYDLKRAIPAYLRDPQLHDLIVIERIRQPDSDRCNGESSRQVSNNTNENGTIANLSESKNENDKSTETRQEHSDTEDNVEDRDHSAQNHVNVIDQEEGAASTSPRYISRRLEPVERERVAPIIPQFLEEIEVEINREQWPNMRTNVGLFSYLSNTITDRTIHSLFNPRAESRNLERLSLNGYSHITDASLLMIATSDQIRYLDVRNTAVTQQGCYAFKTQHPDCEFLCDFCEDDLIKKTEGI